MAERKILNLFERIRNVMRDIQYLMKDDEVGSGNSRYKGITEEKVTQAVRASMIEHGLVLLPTRVQAERSDTILNQTYTDSKGVSNAKQVMNRLTTAHTEYLLVNVDDPSEQVVLASVGSGVDSQDKGVGKAMTYAFKYLLLRLFMVPTGEDPDKIASNDWVSDLPLDGTQPERSPTSQRRTTQRPAPQAQPAPQQAQPAPQAQPTQQPQQPPQADAPQASGRRRNVMDVEFKSGKHTGATIGQLLETKDGRQYVSWYAESGKNEFMVRVCKEALQQARESAGEPQQQALQPTQPAQPAPQADAPFDLNADDDDLPF